MDNLPIEIIRNIYLYDGTYRDVFERSLVRIRIDFYLYRCDECYKNGKNVIVIALFVKHINDFASKSIMTKVI